MGLEERRSTDTAIRPSLAMLCPGTQDDNPYLRAPEEQTEIDRRVAIYAKQVEETGRITWLPHRGEGESA